MKMRLQKYLAKCGVCSRRKAEELIQSGKVKVNGDLVKDVILVGENDLVEVNGKQVEFINDNIYIALNKPIGIITSSKDQFNRKTVIDIINIEERVFSVGRLDYDTSGLLILTNDGDTAYKMTHPSSEFEKTYIAKVKGIPTDKKLNNFREGLKIEDFVTAPAKIKIIKKEKEFSFLEIIIHEGRNRQVRKMCSAIGHEVISLKRSKIGDIELGSLELGKWRYLKEEEIEYLKSI